MHGQISKTMPRSKICSMRKTRVIPIYLKQLALIIVLSAEHSVNSCKSISFNL